LVLPSYASIGIAAPLLLMLCRFGQGVGLGGEWGGAVLLAIENAPPNKRAWYGMFRCTNWFVTFWWNFLDFNGYDEFPRFSGLWLEDSFYSEFVIGSSRFLYPIKITETPLSKIQERTGRSENPVSPY
jgi:MFS family permease